MCVYSIHSVYTCVYAIAVYWTMPVYADMRCAPHTRCCALCIMTGWLCILRWLCTSSVAVYIHARILYSHYCILHCWNSPLLVHICWSMWDCTRVRVILVSKLCWCMWVIRLICSVSTSVWTCACGCCISASRCCTAQLLHTTTHYWNMCHSSHFHLIIWQLHTSDLYLMCTSSLLFINQIR